MSLLMLEVAAEVERLKATNQGFYFSKFAKELRRIDEKKGGRANTLPAVRAYLENAQSTLIDLMTKGG